MPSIAWPRCSIARATPVCPRSTTRSIPTSAVSPPRKNSRTTLRSWLHGSTERMQRTLALLLFLATPLLAQTREPFPVDYKASPCASVAPVCKTFLQSQFADVAAIRGFDLGQEWVDAHWAELNEALAPACSKIAACFSMPNNDFTFCNDLVSEEVFSTTCNRYPEGSRDREKCSFFVRTYLFGHDRNSSGPWAKMQECAKAQPSTGERTLDWWMAPAT